MTDLQLHTGTNVEVTSHCDTCPLRGHCCVYDPPITTITIKVASCFPSLIVAIKTTLQLHCLCT